MRGDKIAFLLCRSITANVHFLGVFARNQIPPSRIHSVQYPECYVVNSDDSSSPGQHWLAVFISSDGILEFFDSYGLPAHFYNIRVSAYRSNSTQIQADNSTTCGHYCIAYLCARSLGFSLTDFLNSFTYCYASNDRFVTKWIRSLTCAIVIPIFHHCFKCLAPNHTCTLRSKQTAFHHLY